MFSGEELIHWFAQYAYEPYLVFAAIIVLMVMSSFGFPVPEEVTLVSAGLIGYMGSHPDKFPPPFPGAEVASVEALATVCFLAVFLSDFLVFTLGRVLGVRFLESRMMRRYQEKMTKISGWAKKYGAYASGIFRFTPGLRFPGHFSCGMLGLSPWKFLAVDGTAALISVPTQVFLVAYYGEEILVYFTQFKMVLFGLLALAAAVWIGYKVKQRLSAASAKAQ